MRYILVENCPAAPVEQLSPYTIVLSDKERYDLHCWLMAEKTQIKAVEMVRRIRDEQAQLLAGKSREEIIAFYRKAGETARRKAKRRQPARRRTH
jgi:hypothetical protein